VHETSSNAMALQLQYLLDKFGLIHYEIVLWKMKATIWEPWL
jgi:hypothetical protein